MQLGRYFLVLTLGWFTNQAVAGEVSLPYSGRLTEDSGKPVDGPVDLVVEFFANDSGGSSSAGPYTFPAVGLQDGVFQINISLGTKELHSIFPSIETPVWIQVTDATNGSVYPRQQLAATPSALKIPVDNNTLGFNENGELELLDSASVSKIGGQKIVATGASNGQVMAWDSASKTWKPANTGVADAEIIEAKLADGAVSGQKLANDAVATAKIADGSVTFPKINHPCTAGKGLQVNGTADGWDCVTIGAGTGDVNNNGNSYGSPMILGTDDAQPLSLESNNAVALTVDRLQDIGIGETNPGATLTIKGSPATPLTGTLDTALGLAAVSGTGTSFDTELTPGDTITIGSETYGVLSITDATNLTLASNAASTQSTAAATRINPVLSAATSDGTERLTVTNSGSVQVPGGIALRDADGDGAHHATLKADPTMAADVTYTLPASPQDGYVLQTNGTGVLSWTDPSSSASFNTTGSAGDVTLTVQGDGSQTANLSEWKKGASTVTVMDENGSIGIGTSNPAAKVNIASNSTATGATDGILIEQAGSGDSAISFKTPGEQYVVGIDQSDSDKFKISDGTDFGTDDRLVIDASGNVGIGTSTPTARLSVAGKLQVQSTNTLELGAGVAGKELSAGSIGYETWSVGKLDIVGAGTSVPTRKIKFWAEGGVDFNGNVGIGSPSPSSELDIRNNDDYTSINVTNNKGASGGTSALQFGLNDGSFITMDAARIEARVSTNPSMALDFKTFNGALETDMTLTEGKVGIGTTAPEEILHLSTDGRAEIVLEGFQDSIGGPHIALRKARGTRAAPTAVTTNSYLGSVTGRGYDGTDFTLARSALRMQATQPWTATDNGSDLTLWTTPNDSTVMLERLTIAENGNVGIGTTVPQEPLHVVGEGTSTAAIISRSFAADGSTPRTALQIGRTNSSGPGADGIGTMLGFFAETETEGVTEVIGTVRAVATDATAGSVEGYIGIGGRASSGPINDTLVVSGTGNVGIGTTSPAQPLEVSSSGSTKLRIDAGAGSHPSLELSENGTVKGYFWHDSANDLMMVGDGTFGHGLGVDSSGNVGIGTTSPSAQMHISSSDADMQIQTDAPAETSKIMFKRSLGTPGSPSSITTGNARMGGIEARGYDGNSYERVAEITFRSDATFADQDTPGRIEFSTTPSGSATPIERMRIDSNGNIGIGTTSPQRLLHLASTDSGGPAFVAIDSQDTTDGNEATISFRTTTTGVGGAPFQELAGVTATFATHDHATRSGSLSFWTNDSGTWSNMSMLGNGNVGIGTTNPNDKLKIAGALANGGLYLDSSNSVAATLDRGASTNDANIIIRTAGTIDWKIGQLSGQGAQDDLSVYSNTLAATTLHIQDATGNIGIGSTSPSARLDVNSPTNIDNAFNKIASLTLPTGSQGGTIGSRTASANQRQGLYLSSIQMLTLWGDSAGDGAGVVDVVSGAAPDAAGDTNSLFRINADGGVGVGTTSPAAKFQVDGADQVESAVVGYGDSPNLGPVFATVRTRNIQSSPAIVQNGDNLGAVSANGWDGDEAAKAAGIEFEVDGIPGNNDMPGRIVLRTTPDGTKATVERMRIDSAGNVGIGTTDPSEKLHVVGNLRVEGSTDCTLGGGSGATNCTSDERLKDNVVEIKNAIQKILALRGVEFDWNDKSRSPGLHSIGVIAQDIEKIFPTAVIENPDNGYKMVDYAVLVAPLIQAIKELSEENTELKGSYTAIQEYLCSQDPSAPFCKEP